MYLVLNGEYNENRNLISESCRRHLPPVLSVREIYET